MFTEIHNSGSLINAGHDRIRVLVIEDNEADVTFIRQALRKIASEAKVDSAQSINQARERLFTSNYDIILVDHHLPDGFGTIFAAELLTSSLCRHGLVAIATGLVDHAEKIIHQSQLPIRVLDKSLPYAESLQILLKDLAEMKTLDYADPPIRASS
ncbi:MAG: response regulator [Mangrovicoccus sp.]